jgi:Flp pilus assembly protein TadG
MKRVTRGNVYRHRGQSLIELAIVLPVLVVVVLLAVDLGRAYFTSVALRGVAEYGVRYAANFPTRTDLQLETKAREEATNASGLIPLDITEVNVTPSPRVTGDDVVMTVRARFTPIVPYDLLGWGPPLTLEGSATSVVIGTT